MAGESDRMFLMNFTVTSNRTPGGSYSQNQILVYFLDFKTYFEFFSVTENQREPTISSLSPKRMGRTDSSNNCSCSLYRPHTLALLLEQSFCCFSKSLCQRFLLWWHNMSLFLWYKRGNIQWGKTRQYYSSCQCNMQAPDAGMYFRL